MSSTPQPLNNYLAYGLVIEAPFSIPFLPFFKNKNSDIQFFQKNLNHIPDKNFYSLSKSRSEYCKRNEVKTKSNKLNIEYEVLNNDINQHDLGFKMLTHPIALGLYSKKDLVLHGSAVSINGRAFLFLGPSGSGKSFLASRLLKKGNLISEDVLRITFRNNKSYVYPSIPVIKLAKKDANIKHILQDSAFDISNDARNRNGYITDKFDKDNKPCPIEGCFILYEKEIDNIRKINDIDAFKNLLFNSFSPLPRNSCAVSEKIVLDNISKFIISTEIFSYERRLNGNISILENHINKA